HVVDRLVMIETGIRGPVAPIPPKPQSPATIEEPSLAEQPKPAPPAIRRSDPVSDPPPPSLPAPAAATLPPGNRAPAAARRPVDPSLPPAPPLHPGLSRARGALPPADRTPESEEALGPARPPVIDDPGGKANFIAAARRAAQGAEGEVAPAGKRTNGSG